MKRTRDKEHRLVVVYNTQSLGNRGARARLNYAVLLLNGRKGGKKKKGKIDTRFEAGRLKVAGEFFLLVNYILRQGLFTRLHFCYIPRDQRTPLRHRYTCACANNGRHFCPNGRRRYSVASIEKTTPVFDWKIKRIVADYRG